MWEIERGVSGPWAPTSYQVCMRRPMDGRINVGWRQHPPGAITQAVLASGPFRFHGDADRMPCRRWPRPVVTAIRFLFLWVGPLQEARPSCRQPPGGHVMSNLRSSGAWHRPCGLLDRKSPSATQHVHAALAASGWRPWAVNNPHILSLFSTHERRWPASQPCKVAT